MKYIKLIPFLLLIFVLVGCGEGEETNVIFEIKPGIDTIEIHGTWVDAGVILTIDGLSSTDYNQSGEVDTQNLGTYTIEYAYIHDNQKVEKIYRYVDVVDQTKPVMTLNPGIDTIHLGELWIDEGITVYDNSGETLTYTVTNELNINQIGFYEVTYRAEDSSGNFQEIVRIVSVIE